MPEGDTIFRTATTMRKWLLGREVTRVQTKVPGLDAQRIVGKTIDEVTPKAKHLLVRFSNGLTLHTHMRMTGSWHLYRTGDKWQKPAYQAKIVIECGERLAVCFNAPVVEMLTPTDEKYHGSLISLGPDVLGPAEQFSLDEIHDRASRRDPDYTLGELLLDQQVVSGIGNIYRCESLFLEKHHPWKPQSAITIEELDALILTGQRLMKSAIGPKGDLGRDFGTGSPNAPWVYGRTGKPCRVCGTFILTKRLGKQARDAYWCPTCQPQEAWGRVR